MTALVNFYNSIRRNDEGQDLLEYALLVALIAIVAVGAVTAAGNAGVGDLHADRGRHLAPLALQHTGHRRPALRGRPQEERRRC